MKLCGGIREQNLTLALMGVEAICAVIAVLIYW